MLTAVQLLLLKHMRQQLIRWFGAALCISITSIFALPAVAQNDAAVKNYPDKPIRLVIPFPPGGATDVIGRIMAQELSKTIGQQVVPDNRAGDSGNIGADMVAKSAPDGYTLLMGALTSHSINSNLDKDKIKYNLEKDFTPVAIVGVVPLVFVVNPSVPVKNMKEFIAYAKANPGKLTVATNGEGGFPHLIFEHLRMMGNFSFNHIPYKGSAQIATDLIGGQVQAGVDGVTGLTPHIKSGRINLLAVTSKNRAPQWPDAPAASEAVPGYESGGWFGFVGPAGMPRDIVMRLNDEINRAMRSPDVTDKLIASGLNMVYESPDYFGEIIKSDFAKYGKLVRDIGFKPQ